MANEFGELTIVITKADFEKYIPAEIFYEYLNGHLTFKRAYFKMICALDMRSSESLRISSRESFIPDRDFIRCPTGGNE